MDIQSQISNTQTTAKTIFFAAVLIILILFPTKQTFAQVSSLKLSPFLIQQDLKKGLSFDTNVKITNSSTKAKYLTLSLRNFLPSGNDGSTEILADTQDSPYGLVKWITITKQPEYQLSAGQSTEVDLHITAPPESIAGSYYGALLFTLSDQLPKTGESQIIQQAATLLIVDVDRSFENAKVENFTLNRIGNEQNRLQFETVISNTGLSSLAPKGKIEIHDWQNRLVATSFVNPDADLILPNTKRDFISAANGGFSGPYSAELTVWYGSKKLEIHKSMFFWVWPPLDTMLKLVIYLIIFMALLRLLIKRYNAWIIKKYG